MKALIWGTNISGKIAYDILTSQDGEYNVLGFIDKTETINYEYLNNIGTIKVYKDDTSIPNDMFKELRAIVIGVGESQTAHNLKKKLLNNVNIQKSNINIETVFDEKYYETYKSLLENEINSREESYNFINEDLLDTNFKKNIIIGGPPRTGSTLFRFILDTSSEIISGPESGFFLSTLSENQNNVISLSNKLSNLLDISQDFIGKIIMNSSNLFQAYDRIMSVYQKSVGNNKSIWAEKTPRNCYHYSRLKVENPNTLFISTIRNGLDVVTSYHPSKPNEYWCSIQRYIDSMKLVYSFKSKNHLIVRYEDLIENPEGTLKQVFDFIDIPFEQSVLEEFYKQTKTRDYSKVNHDKIKKGLKKDWIERYKKLEHKQRVEEFLNNEEAMYWFKRSGYTID